MSWQGKFLCLRLLVLTVICVAMGVYLVTRAEAIFPTVK